jgi:hypothetical protein
VVCVWGGGRRKAIVGFDNSEIKNIYVDKLTKDGSRRKRHDV